MKVVILAGGYGTRISEETHLKPKPMVEIGQRPIIWHIMKLYSFYGINDFIICCGYKGYCIKEYFANYPLHSSDVTFDFSSNTTKIHRYTAEPWRVTLVDTGLDTMTGGRLLKVKDYLDDSVFCLTYGDGLSNVNIAKLIECHSRSNSLATVTAVRPPGRFGALQFDTGGSSIESFTEKPGGDGSWINGGYFVLNPKVLDLIEHEMMAWEDRPLSLLAESGQLNAFRHSGFWQPMDTLRDKNTLESLWDAGSPPWRVWM